LYCDQLKTYSSGTQWAEHQSVIDSNSIKGYGCFLEKETLPSLLRTGCTGSGMDLSGFTIKLSLIEGLIGKIDLNVE